MKIIKQFYLFFLVSAYLLGGCGESTELTQVPNGSLLVNTPLATTGQFASELKDHTLTVYAAASLMDAFQEIAVQFEANHPGTTVNFNYAGSQILRTQLEQGALADLFASADHMNMDVLVDEDLVVINSQHDFVSNRLVVILPPDNPGDIQSLLDLANSGLSIVLADDSVPAGNYAYQVLVNLSKDHEFGEDYFNSVLRNVVSYETDVRQVVTKIELGEADAGIVYQSDAIATPDLITLPIPVEFNVTARYPIAIMANSPNPDLAAAFIAYLTSPDGEAILSMWGFSPGQ